MIYYVISKKELINGEIKTTVIGHVLKQSEVDFIHENYNGNTYFNWLESNSLQLENGTLKTSDFFNSIPTVFICSKKTNYLDSFSEKQIDNLNNLN